MTIQILEKKFVVSTKSIRYKIWGDDYDELLDWKNNFMHSYGLGYAVTIWLPHTGLHVIRKDI